MGNPWFRMYVEFADDPKVQMMPEAMQRRLLMLFCERGKGETLHETERAFHWRVTEAQLAETKAVFIAKGFIDENWALINWNRRQFISDSSTERVRRHRSHLKQDETLQEQSSTVTVTAPDTEVDTETETEKPCNKERQVSLTPDSADARILSETVGIFGMHPQADMLRCLVSYATSSGKSPPDCIEHMAARWEGYRSKPRGRFGYTSSYKFFMSGLWDEPEKWSTEEGANGGSGKNQGDGRSPTSDRVNRNLGAIAKALERRGIAYPVGSGGADGAAVSGAGPGAEPGGVSGGFRAVGPEILPPQSAGRTG